MFVKKEVMKSALTPTPATSDDRGGKRKKYVRSWADLPPELLELVQSNLILGDSINFSLTCRQWLPISLPFPPPPASYFSQLPYLMVLSDDNNSSSCNCKFFQPLNKKVYHINIPELADAKIRYSNHGWLLMSRATSRFFFNPFTMEKIQLPDLSWDYLCQKHFFSSPPTSPDCIIIVFKLELEYLEPKSIEFMTLRRGQDKWTHHAFRSEVYMSVPSDSFVLLKNKLYFLGMWGGIGVLDLSDMSWYAHRAAYQCQNTYMLKSHIEEDGMLAVFCYYMYKKTRVEVMRLDLVDMTFRPVDDLGDCALYVSFNTSCFLEKAAHRGMANKIYFPKILGGESMVFYSLDSGSYHVNYDKKMAVRNFRDKKFSTWIKPTYDRESLASRSQMFVRIK